METMETISLPAAVDSGLDSLWTCDVLYACSLIRDGLDRRGELVTAVSLGYPHEDPAARPRTPWPQLTEWRALP